MDLTWLWDTLIVCAAFAFGPPGQQEDERWTYPQGQLAIRLACHLQLTAARDHHELPDRAGALPFQVPQRPEVYRQLYYQALRLPRLEQRDRFPALWLCEVNREHHRLLVAAFEQRVAVLGLFTYEGDQSSAAVIYHERYYGLWNELCLCAHTARRDVIHRRESLEAVRVLLGPDNWITGRLELP